MTAAAPTRDRILEAGHTLVLNRGFAATTVDAVLTGAGVSKGAFFHHFASKAELGRALVERYATADADTLEQQMAMAEATTDEPGEQLVAFLRQFEQLALAEATTEPACLFVSFIYEHELTDPATTELVRRAVEHWRSRILDKLEAAALTRPRLSSLDLHALADHVFVTFEGAFLLVRIEADPEHMRRQIAHLRHYVELLMTEGASR